AARRGRRGAALGLRPCRARLRFLIRRPRRWLAAWAVPLRAARRRAGCGYELRLAHLQSARRLSQRAAILHRRAARPDDAAVPASRRRAGRDALPPDLSGFRTLAGGV